MARFHNILYVTEETVEQGVALERVFSLATRNRSKLTILHVAQPTIKSQEEATAYCKRALETLIAPFRDRHIVHIDVSTGTTFLEVIRAVLRNGHDLVAKPAENPAFLQRLFGSTDKHLLRKCPCPVWLMKPGETPVYNSILAAVDFDPTNLKLSESLNMEILVNATVLALADSAHLHVVHAWEPFGERTLIDRGDFLRKGISRYVDSERSRHRKGMDLLVQATRDRLGTDVYNGLAIRFHLMKGPAKKMISIAATRLRANLVIMGTVARTGVPGVIIGNTAEAILDQLTCSVLAVKPPGFVTPVMLDI